MPYEQINFIRSYGEEERTELQTEIRNSIAVNPVGAERVREDPEIINGDDGIRPEPESELVQGVWEINHNGGRWHTEDIVTAIQVELAGQRTLCEL